MMRRGSSCSLRLLNNSAQRALYQAKVELAVHDASANKDHEDRVYTFVVDFGQIM
jgi:hypothetical protein